MKEKQTKDEAQVLIFAQKSKEKEGDIEEFHSRITITDSDVTYFDDKILFLETHKYGRGYTPEGIIIVEYDDRNTDWIIKLFMKLNSGFESGFFWEASTIVDSEKEITDEIKFMVDKKFREKTWRIRDLTLGQNWYSAKEEIRKWLWEFYKKIVFGSEPDYKFDKCFEQIINSQILDMHKELISKDSSKIQDWEDLLGVYLYYYAYLTYFGNYDA